MWVATSDDDIWACEKDVWKMTKSSPKFRENRTYASSIYYKRYRMFGVPGSPDCRCELYFGTGLQTVKEIRGVLDGHSRIGIKKFSDRQFLKIGMGQTCTIDIIFGRESNGWVVWLHNQDILCRSLVKIVRQEREGKRIIDLSMNSFEMVPTNAVGYDPLLIAAAIKAYIHFPFISESDRVILNLVRVVRVPDAVRVPGTVVSGEVDHAIDSTGLCGVVGCPLH